MASSRGLGKLQTHYKSLLLCERLHGATGVVVRGIDLSSKSRQADMLIKVIHYINEGSSVRGTENFTDPKGMRQRLEVLEFQRHIYIDPMTGEMVPLNR
jgi:hypothetical protein